MPFPGVEALTGTHHPHAMEVQGLPYYARVIDARTRQEFEGDHMLGSVHVELPQFVTAGQGRAGWKLRFPPSVGCCCCCQRTHSNIGKDRIPGLLLLAQFMLAGACAGVVVYLRLSLGAVAPEAIGCPARLELAIARTEADFATSNIHPDRALFIRGNTDEANALLVWLQVYFRIWSLLVSLPLRGVEMLSNVSQWRNVWNLRLRRYFFLRRHLGDAYLSLLQFFLNPRVFMRSRRTDRVGKMPKELLTGQAHVHWLELLGFQRLAIA